MSQRPLYYRLLRLQHIQPRGPVTFAFFEGSIGVAGLLALAEIVSWWGLLAIPVTVALMVKLNDVVAGLLGAQPLAFGHMGGSALVAGAVAGGAVAGRSAVPGRANISEVDTDPISAPTTRGRAAGVARGVAAVPPPPRSRPHRPRHAWPHFGPTGEAGNNRPHPEQPTRRPRGNQGRFPD